MAVHHGKEGEVAIGGTGVGELQLIHFRNNRRCC
jgi:hypothetical protein